MKIKHLLLILIILFIAIGIAFWWFTLKKEDAVPEPINLKPKSELAITAVGDSLVAGTGSTRGNDFVSVLSRKLGVPITNKGIPGDTSKEVLVRIDSIIQTQPDIVILLVGGNDALQRLPVDATFKNIAAIIQKLQKNGISVVLVGIQGNILENRYQDQFDALAKEYNVIYVPDILDGIITNKQYMSDVVHPNDLGYAIMAEKIYQEVKRGFPEYGL